MGRIALSLGLVSSMGIIIACGGEVASESGSRAQRLAPASSSFIGRWDSPAHDTVSKWTVQFSGNGRVTMAGPGLTADGTYVATDGRATARWDHLEMESTLYPNLESTTFNLGPSRKSVSFATGAPLDPPVTLEWSGSGR